MKNKVLSRVLAVIIALMIFAVGFVAGYFTHGCTRDTAVQSYEWFVKTVDDNYYFGNSSDFKNMNLKEIAEKYLDRYSEYYTAEEYSAQLKSNAGSKSGLGVSYSYIEGKGIYLSSVVGNSPAYNCNSQLNKKGLRAGEILVSGSANGVEKTFKSKADFAQIVNAAGDREMTFTSADGETFTVAKAEYTASYAYMCTNKTAWVFGDAASGGLALYEREYEKISYLPEGFAYINLSQFYGTAAQEFYKLIEKFNATGCTSLILDLRSNGGGYVSVMQDIAGCFSGGQVKPAMISRDKHGSSQVYNCARVAEASRVKEGTEVFVLANSGTASASEALIGAMHCYGALEYENIFLSDYSEEYLAFAGSEKTACTYGKGIMQSTFENHSTGEALKLTTAQIYWPDGETCIHDRGIIASDGCKKVYAEWQYTKGDPELQRAIEMMK